MKCENLQLNLSTYLDDCLTQGERAEIEKHLPQCPLCRQKLADFQSVRNDLRNLSRPNISASVLSSIRNRIALETQARKPERIFLETFIRGESSSRWWKVHLMPYSLGTALSLALGLTLLWSLLSVSSSSNASADTARLESIEKSAVLLAKSNSGMRSSESSAPDFSKLSAPSVISRESPSINPKGALAAAAKSLVRGKAKDAEVVVVADVYGSGLAEIAQIVEPSSDRRTVRELERALKSDSEYAPFMSAKFDNREDKTVRVVLKIQRVDVDTQ
jgi:anti-sigma factor RsiW